MATPEPLLVWTDALTELVGFIASFLAAGAIGLRFAVLRPFTAPRANVEERQLASLLAARGAWLGVIGTAGASRYPLPEGIASGPDAREHGVENVFDWRRPSLAVGVGGHHLFGGLTVGVQEIGGRIPAI